jgi:hypothetical protein
VKSQLFYEGHWMGEVDSTSSISHAWVCVCCGRLFAQRVVEEERILPEGDSPSGEIRWTHWRTYCARCFNANCVHQHELECLFHRGLGAHTVATIAAQFLYEWEIYERTISAKSIRANTLFADYGFDAASEHSWPQSTSYGR